ncbi:aminopeptidase P family protein [Mycoplasmatota bacterium]|nr:aminopeptidase P family protein [Mycoplasmatota bacterium]
MDLEKIKQLETLLEKSNVDMYLVLSREDSDITMSLFLDVHIVAQTAIIFRRNGKHIVLTGATDANAYSSFGIFEIITVEDDFYRELVEIIDKIEPNKIALNISTTDYLADGLTMGQYLCLESTLRSDRLKELEVSSEDLLNEIRSVKSEYEIKLIEKAVQITCDIYDEVRSEIRVGMSETEIGDLFVAGLKKYGVINALGGSYNYPLVMINRCGLAHREPVSSYVLEKGDILICDFSVIYEGYCSDIARSFYVLKDNEKRAPKDVQDAFDTTVKAVSNIISNMKPGLKGYEIDSLGRSVIEAGGYPTIRHSAGHQLGRKVHDGGTPLSPYSENRPRTMNKIRVNEVYAIEPTVIQDNGLPSFIVEEDIVVSKNGVRVLSRRQTELWLI